jgi:hypothetical protein
MKNGIAWVVMFWPLHLVNVYWWKGIPLRKKDWKKRVARSLLFLEKQYVCLEVEVLPV